MLSRSSITEAVHLMTIEKPLFSFLARFAARFSIKVFCGFFLSCFFASLPLLMFVAPYDWVNRRRVKPRATRRYLPPHQVHHITILFSTAVLKFLSTATSAGFVTPDFLFYDRWFLRMQ
jgi:hypothetical protein